MLSHGGSGCGSVPGMRPLLHGMRRDFAGRHADHIKDLRRSGSAGSCSGAAARSAVKGRPVSALADTWSARWLDSTIRLAEREAWGGGASLGRLEDEASQAGPVQNSMKMR